MMNSRQRWKKASPIVLVRRKPQCEDKIKEATKATLRCIPLEQPDARAPAFVAASRPVKERIFAKAY